MTTAGSMFGQVLRSYRERAGLSQLALAGDAGVSARHLGFLELGRSDPTVRMVQRLAAALALTTGERNRMLLAAGFAPVTVGLNDTSAHLIGQDAFATALALGSAATPDQAVDIAAQALAELGIHQFITGVIRRQPGRLTVDRDPVGRPAVGWLKHMQDQGHHERDYLLSATAGSQRAFHWDDVRHNPMTPGQRRILDEARDFRISGGFVVPVHRPDGSVRAFSSWFEHFDASPAKRTAAAWIATCLLDALDRTAPSWEPDNVVRLRPEYRNALLRITDGPYGRNQRIVDPVQTRCLDQAILALGASSAVAAAGRAAALGLLD